MLLPKRTTRWRFGWALAALGAIGAMFAAPAQAVTTAARTTSARTSVHATNVHATNVNVSRNVNVVQYDRWGHPLARAAAVTATAVAVGTIVASLPPSCSSMVVGAVTYQNCGGVYYQPVYQGSNVQYVVVNAPP